MPAAAQPALGTTISIDKLGTAITYTQLGQVKSIEGVGGYTIGEVDTAHLSSIVRTTRPGLPDPKDITFEVNFDPSDVDHVYVRDMAGTPSVKSWKVSFPTTPAKTGTFDAWVKEMDGVSAGGVDENLTASFTLRRVSIVTWAP